MPFPLVAAAVLPAVIATVLRFLVGTLIVRVITALGIFVATFTGLDYATSEITDYIDSAMNGVTGDVYTIANMIGFFDCVQILIGAWISAIAIKQLLGAFNRLTFGRSSA